MNDPTKGLVDIVEPVGPDVIEGTNWLILSAEIGLVLISAGALYYAWKYKLPAYLALRDLHKLHKQLQSGEITPHESTLMLALNVRHNLAVKRLRADAMPKQIGRKEQGRWVAFMQLLDANLYQKSADVNSDSLRSLFTQSEYWLQRYSRRSTLKKMG